MAQFFDIRPNLVGDYDTWTLGAGASKVAAVDPLSPIAHDDNASYIAVATPTVTRQSFKMGQRPEMFTVSAVKGYARWRSLNNYNAAQTLRLFARINTTDSADLVLTGAGDAVGNWTDGQDGRDFGTLPRPGGGSFSVSDLMDSTLQIGCYVSSYAAGVVDVWVTSLWIRVYYVPVPSRTSDSRLRASRYVLMNGRGPGEFSLVTTPEVGCDIPLLDPFTLTHKQWPASNGLGATTDPWTRPVLIATRRETMPELDRTKLTGYVASGFLVSFYESGHSAKSASVFADGVMRIDGGNTRTFSRDSKAWVEDPGGGEVREVGDDLERYDTRGLLLENASTNYLRRSSFINGTTGLILVNANGGGQGTVAVDTTDLLFDPAVTANSMKITALTVPQATDLGFSTASTLNAVPANQDCAFSLDYKNDTGGSLELQLQRSVDSFYYDPTIPGWRAAVTTLTLPVSTSKTRYRLANIDIGTNATTITARLIQLAGATAADQIDHVYHMQFESVPWVTGRIVTTTASVTRDTESLRISNNTGVRAWYGQRGTAYFKFFPDFDASVMNAYAGFPNWFTLEYDANNYWKFLYDGSTGSLARFEVRAAGTTYAAWAPYTPVAYDPDGTWLTIRWTSDRGEWGLPPYTLSVFVDGVKGTDVSLPALPTETATSNLYIGGNDVDWAANGAMRYIRFVPRVHSDDEVARHTAA